MIDLDAETCLYTLWVESIHEDKPSRRCVGSAYRPAGWKTETIEMVSGEKRITHFVPVDLDLPSPEFAFDIPY